MPTATEIEQILALLCRGYQPRSTPYVPKPISPSIELAETLMFSFGLNFKKLMADSGLLELGYSDKRHFRSKPVFDRKNIQDLRLVAQHFSFLEHLECFRNELPNLDGIEKFCNLKIANFNKNKLVSLQALQNVQAPLQKLQLSENLLTEFPNVPNLSHLQELDISYNQIRRFKSFPVLPKLQFLECQHNQLESLLGLETCENLVFLNCSHNQLRSLQALNKLPKIERLFCAGNELVHLEGIQHLSQITHLNLSDNELSDVSFLQYLPNLQELDISNNIISDFSVVKKLSLKRLSFHGNPGAEDLHPGTFSHLYKTKKKIKKFL